MKERNHFKITKKTPPKNSLNNRFLPYLKKICILIRGFDIEKCAGKQEMSCGKAHSWHKKAYSYKIIRTDQRPDFPGFGGSLFTC